ncbi:toll/interleukin-1 receptor domain-containing protein [Bowmanella yangjiangensis]|uniref:TIR domain-containing protein n=1 Tax=Bowmanella yangjiangensis TaxID=2811230 RepID=A0ABS3CTC5_9ALTE|nr:toll/interleukin-1 receptor domain-containing protein [Bowmanella yangjiangensis]MBN7819764.1 TIR domain-containing protein [Bowmanella yangjiangensis]
MSGNTSTNPTYDVFISYSSKDEGRARELVNELEAKGYRCWIAVRDLFHSGNDYSLTIPRVIAQSRCVLLLLTADANQSRHVRNELDIAFEKQIPIFPMKLDATDGAQLEWFLRSSQWFDAVDARVDEMVDAIVAKLENKELQVSLKPKRFPFKKNWLGITAALAVLAFVLFSVWEWFYLSPIPSPIADIQELKAEDFVATVEESYKSGPVMLRLRATGMGLMSSSTLATKQYEFIYEFDTGQRTEAIQMLVLAQIEVDTSFAIPNEVKVTVRDLDGSLSSDPLTFSLPQMKKIMGPRGAEKLAERKRQLDGRLSCDKGLAYTAGFPLCQFGSLGQGESLETLQPVIERISFGTEKDHLTDILYLNPLKTEGELLARVSEQQELLVLLPRKAEEIYYRLHFSDGEQGKVNLLKLHVGLVPVTRLSSNSESAPPLFLSRDFNMLNFILVPLNSAEISQISWSVYPGVDNAMQQSDGLFYADKITKTMLEDASQLDVTYVDEGGKASRYSYQLNLAQTERAASVESLQNKPQSLIECQPNECHFKWMAAGQAEIDTIDDIFIGLDAQEMFSINHDDLSPLVAQMESRRQPLYAEAQRSASANPRSSLSFGTPVNTGSVSLLDRLAKPSAFTVNPSWKKREATRTSPIVKFSWPVGPLFIQLKWMDGTRSDTAVYKVPYK